MAGCFRTKTRDGSAYGLAYLKGQLRLESARTFTGVAQESKLAAQNMQHFSPHLPACTWVHVAGVGAGVSNSPWSATGAMELIQRDLMAIPELQHGGVLILDEMADEKAGTESAGAGQQYNGRLKRVAMSQVGVIGRVRTC